MKKLQIKRNGAWEYVFCQNAGNIITTKTKRKALDAKYHLDYFRNHYGNDEFRESANK
jgi:hypothetical protein